MRKRVMLVVASLLVFGCMVWAADKPYTGTISDSNCGAKHASPSADAAACVAKCVSGGGKYVLVSKGKVYQLDPQDKINSDLAGKKAKVTGSLSGDTITVSSAEAAAAGKKSSKKAG